MLNWLSNGEPVALPGNRLADYCFMFATAILFFLCSNLLLTGLLFLVGGHAIILIAWISLGFTILFSFWYTRFSFERRILGFIIVILAACAVFLVSIALNRTIYDISYDGQTYQQEGVIRLSSGWDPVYQDLSPSIIGGEEKWINYYPKASWINEAYLYLFTHAERDAKALNIVLMIVSGAFLYVAFTDMDWLRPSDAAVVSFLLGANPVSVYQSLSFYIDGQLMSLFLSIVALFLIMYAGKRRFAFLPFAFAVPIFINLKFTALLDALILLVIFTLAAWTRGREALAAKTVVVGGLALCIGVLVIGFSPYITNIIRYRTPFYPLLGPGAIDLKPYNVPGNFIDKNAPEIFFLSFFSEPAEIKGAGTASVYHFPFTYDSGALVAFRYPDANVGGFGPLFGGAFIVALIIMALCIGKRGFALALIAMLAVVVISVIDPIASLARYVPQAYLLAVIPVILLLFLRGRWSRRFAYLATALLFFNIYLIASTYIAYNIRISQGIGYELGLLAAQSEKNPIAVYFNEFRSTRVMLEEAGVDYASTTDPNACPVGFQQILPENTTEFCVMPSS